MSISHEPEVMPHIMSTGFTSVANVILSFKRAHNITSILPCISSQLYIRIHGTVTHSLEEQICPPSR